MHDNDVVRVEKNRITEDLTGATLRALFAPPVDADPTRPSLPKRYRFLRL
jgi:hypothetical protein